MVMKFHVKVFVLGTQAQSPRHQAAALGRQIGMHRFPEPIFVILSVISRLRDLSKYRRRNLSKNIQHESDHLCAEDHTAKKEREFRVI